MKLISGTPRVILVYLVCLIASQAAAVCIGLSLDRYSATVALSVFIPLYYAMFWVAWRVALWVGDDSQKAAGDSGRPPAKTAAWLLAPAVLALDLCD